MGTGIFDITKLSAAMIDINRCNQIIHRTFGLDAAGIKDSKDNGVFVKEKWSQNYENRNLSKAGC
ncbi:MAG: hypothetical protein KBT11_07955 [Treponema sp.]|nr:hypothetical protein [Candidatus Treponema equifaecale]